HTGCSLETLDMTVHERNHERGDSRCSETGRFYECVPPFTHGVFHRAVRLMMPTMIRESHAVTLTPPSEVACRLPWGWRSSVFLAGMSSRLSMIPACCSPLRHVSPSPSAVAKGVTWR